MACAIIERRLFANWRNSEQQTTASLRCIGIHLQPGFSAITGGLMGDRSKTTFVDFERPNFGFQGGARHAQSSRSPSRSKHPPVTLFQGSLDHGLLLCQEAL